MRRDLKGLIVGLFLIDHNDISDWERAGVEVDGGHHESLTCDGIVDDPATQSNVRIERNFLHHN